MRYRRLDENHDMCFGRGIADYLEDTTGNPVAISQAIKTRLLLFLGEWWANTRDGLPLWQQILGQRVRDKNIVSQILVERIQGLITPDGKYAITSVNKVSSVYDAETREYSFTCSVNTIFGEVVVTNATQGGN
jgi:hypothetical protein